MLLLQSDDDGPHPWGDPKVRLRPTAVATGIALITAVAGIALMIGAIWLFPPYVLMYMLAGWVLGTVGLWFALLRVVVHESGIHIQNRGADVWVRWELIKSIEVEERRSLWGRLPYSLPLMPPRHFNVAVVETTNGQKVICDALTSVRRKRATNVTAAKVALLQEARRTWAPTPDQGSLGTKRRRKFWRLSA